MKRRRPSGRAGDVLSGHHSTAGIALDKALIVVEFCSQAAEERGDIAGHDAWKLALEAIVHAGERFRWARSQQTYKRQLVLLSEDR